jgi:hypothetical protein
MYNSSDFHKTGLERRLQSLLPVDDEWVKTTNVVTTNDERFSESAYESQDS